MTVLIVLWAVVFVPMFAWLWWEHRKPISDTDRRLDHVDRELDEQRARDAVRVQRTVHAEPMPRRRNGGGWVA